MRRLSIILIFTFFITTNFIYGKSSTEPKAEKLSGNKYSELINKLPQGVSIYRLDNGIQVLLIEKPASPMVGINTVVKVGSAYETFATSGMSHMLEHLLFNGTNSLTQKQLYDAVDKIGGYNNANTSEYYTNFMMVTPADNIEAGMKIQADMLFHSILPKKKFKKEKKIVLEEIAKTLANPESQVQRNVNLILFKGHALSLPTLGTYETIQGMNRNEVYKFYKNFYVPNNMIVSVIGNFKTSKMLRLLNKIYGKEKPGNVIYPNNPQWAVGFNLQKVFTSNQPYAYHRFYKGRNKILQLFFKLPQSENPEFFNLMELFLNKKIYDFQTAINKAFPNSIKAINFSTNTTPIKNYLEVEIILKKDNNLSPIVDFITGEISKLKFILPKATIATQAIKEKTKFYKNTEKPHMFGIFNANQLATSGIESVLNLYSGDEFYTAAKDLAKFKINSKPIIIIEHPLKTKSTNEKENNLTAKLFNNGSFRPVVIAKQVMGSDLLAIHYLIKNKSEYESEFGKNAAEIWQDAFGQRMKSAKNQKISSQYGFTFKVNDNPYIPMDNIYLNPAFGYIRVEGLADNTKDAISYLNTQMENFVPTKKEYKKALNKFKSIALMTGGNRAKKLFTEKLNDLIYQKAKFKPNKNKISYENLLKFGKVYFTPANMIISVVSPVEPNQINKYFSDFKSGNDSSLITSSPLQAEYKIIKKKEKVSIKGGGEQSYLFFGFEKNVSKSDIPALKALSLLLGDKIVFNIREKQGLAYGMNAGVNVIKNIAMFYIKMATRPANVDKLIPQFPNFFRKTFANSITKNNLTRVVNMYLGRMMFRRLSSINQAYYLGDSYYFFNNINQDSEFFNKLKHVKLKNVKKVAKKYLGAKNYIELIVR